MVELFTERLRLIQLDYAHFALLLDGVERLERALGLVPSGAELDRRTRVALEDLYSWMERAPEHAQWFACWQIVLQKASLLLGSFCFMGPPNVRGEVEAGYGLFPTSRGHGYMTEAMREACRWAFAQPGVKKVIALTEEGNDRSCRVLSRLGMRGAQ